MFRASQCSLQRFYVCRCVYTGGSVIGEKHMNLYTIFKRAQLLERLRAFQWCRFPFHKIEKRFASKSIHTLMSQILNRNRSITREGDWVAREINRVMVVIDNHLHLIRRRRFGAICEGMRSGNDIDVRIGAQRFNHSIEKPGIDERLVALDINNDAVVGAMTGDLGDAIRSALMLFGGHCNLSAPIKGGVGNPPIVSRDDDGIQTLCPAATFPHMPEKRFVCNEMQRFSRKT